MKHGDPLRFWRWSGVLLPVTVPLLELKAGVVPLGLTVIYRVKNRQFLSGLPPWAQKPISPDRIDERAVAEALGVSLTYEDSS